MKMEEIIQVGKSLSLSRYVTLLKVVTVLQQKIFPNLELTRCLEAMV